MRGSTARKRFWSCTTVGLRRTVAAPMGRPPQRDRLRAEAIKKGMIAPAFAGVERHGLAHLPWPRTRTYEPNATSAARQTRDAGWLKASGHTSGKVSACTQVLCHV